MSSKSNDTIFVNWIVRAVLVLWFVAPVIIGSIADIIFSFNYFFLVGAAVAFWGNILLWLFDVIEKRGLVE